MTLETVEHYGNKQHTSTGESFYVIYAVIYPELRKQSQSKSQCLLSSHSCLISASLSWGNCVPINCCIPKYTQVYPRGADVWLTWALEQIQTRQHYEQVWQVLLPTAKETEPQRAMNHCLWTWTTQNRAARFGLCLKKEINQIHYIIKWSYLFYKPFSSLIITQGNFVLHILIDSSTLAQKMSKDMLKYVWDWAEL